MKNEEVLAILGNAELDDNAKLAKIQALNGVDRQAEITKREAEIASLKAQHEADKVAWDEEKKKYETYVSKEDYDKAMTQLGTYKEAEENNKKLAYLKTLKVKDGYENLIAGQLDWSKAEWDAENKTFKGDDFTKSIEGVKAKYGELFATEQPKLPNRGYFTPPINTEDLTKL